MVTDAMLCRGMSKLVAATAQGRLLLFEAEVMRTVAASGGEKNKLAVDVGHRMVKVAHEVCDFKIPGMLPLTRSMRSFAFFKEPFKAIEEIYFDVQCSKGRTEHFCTSFLISCISYQGCLILILKYGLLV